MSLQLASMRHPEAVGARQKHLMSPWSYALTSLRDHGVLSKQRFIRFFVSQSSRSFTAARYKILTEVSVVHARGIGRSSRGRSRVVGPDPGACSVVLGNVEGRNISGHGEQAS